MQDTRRFRRVKYSAPCSLTYESTRYGAMIHDISVNGAMLGFEDSVMIPETESCSLDITIAQDQPPLHLTVEVVYSSYFTMGVKFTYADETTRRRLNDLVESLLAAAVPADS